MDLLIQPWHIVTRGRFDGEFGIATRGYVICPSLVSRLPVDGSVSSDKLFGSISDKDLEAVLRSLGWVGELEVERYGLEGVWSSTGRIVAEVVGLDVLEAAVMSSGDQMIGIVTCLEVTSAELSLGGTVGETASSDAGAVTTMCLVVGVIEDKPGEGSCQNENPEPC